MRSYRSTVIVVPCYNEAERLPISSFEAFLGRGEPISFLFVDDGSTDRTQQLLIDLAGKFPGAAEISTQPVNMGKAEAVRSGMLRALDREPDFVGFWDADLATPLEFIPEFISVLESDPKIQIALGARVKLLGRDIRRKPLRHYLGRVFATVASMVLNLAIYDTQCGAKLFRATPELRQTLDAPFLSKWVFDVEILARELKRHNYDSRLLAESIFEVPLRKWIDVDGSKVRPKHFFIAFYDMLRIYRTYLRNPTLDHDEVDAKGKNNSAAR